MRQLQTQEKEKSIALKGNEKGNWQKVGEKSAPIGAVVLVAGSLLGRPLATMLAPTSLLKRDGKR
jgi:hypothetical protein